MKEKENLVITIGRQYGSGGRIVGKALAEELGIGFAFRTATGGRICQC